MLAHMIDPPMLTDLSEYLNETIELNDAKMKIENSDTEDIEISALDVKFTCGLHIDRVKNNKELRKQIIPIES